MCRRALGREHNTTLSLRNQRAYCLVALGRMEEAQQECEALLPLLERTAGPEHPDVMLLTNNLASCMITVPPTDPAGALTLIDRALAQAGGDARMRVTRGQVLWQVEMPLAVPAIVAGLRIATVTTIGTATIAAAIGAGGLGVFIFRGIATVDTATIFAGAVPAAVWG